MIWVISTLIEFQMKKVGKAPMNHRRNQYTPLEVHEPLQTVWTSLLHFLSGCLQASSVEFNAEAVEKWKSVCLAVFLLLLGVMFFVFSLLNAAGHFVDSHGAVRLHQLLMSDMWHLGMGLLCIGPFDLHSRWNRRFVRDVKCRFVGFYHSRIAYYAWRGYSGYSLRSIPTFWLNGHLYYTWEVALVRRAARLDFRSKIDDFRISFRIVRWDLGVFGWNFTDLERAMSSAASGNSSMWSGKPNALRLRMQSQLSE